MKDFLRLSDPQNKRIVTGAIIVLIFAVSVFTIHQFLNRDRELYNLDGSIAYRGPVIESTQANYETLGMTYDFQGYVPHGYGDVWTSTGTYVGKVTFVNGHTDGPAETYKYGMNRKTKGMKTDNWLYTGYVEYYTYSEPKCQGEEYLLYQGYISENYQYPDGEGRLYYRCSDQIRYEGTFDIGKFVEGRWYDRDGTLIKEGKFDPPDPGGSLFSEEE